MKRVMMLVPLLAALLGGCQEAKPDILKPHPVTGKVIYDGKPAVGVRVTLIPTDAPMVPKIPQNPHAVTRADGTFTISTFGEGDGAPEGGYQLVLSWPVDPAEKSARTAKGEKVESSEEAQDTDQLMGWYDPLHSTISVRVKSGANTVPAITIPKISSPPPVSQGIPGRN
jgi:hypothetical protein